MLPEEILDYILSLCQDVHCLEASTRAHPLLSRIAQKHLYANIVLHNHTKYDSYSTQLPLDVGQLSNLLSKRSRIANYVHSLTIETSSNDDDLLPFLEAVPSILSILPKLRKAELHCPMGQEFEVYPTLPESLCLSLEKCVGLPSMKQVLFRGMEIPSSLLRQCGNAIEKLTIEYCMVYNPDAEVGDSSDAEDSSGGVEDLSGEVEDSSGEVEDPSDCPTLDKLSIIDVENQALETLVHCVASGCRQLSRLRFTPFDRNMGEPFVLIKPILVLCSNSLTFLDVDASSLYDYDDDREPWTLPTLPHLQTFVFHDSVSVFSFDVLTWLLGFMPNLGRLILHLDFGITSLDTDWSKLDAFLATSRSSTKSIVLEMGTRVAGSVTCRNMKPYLMEHPNIKTLVEQNVLDIRMVHDGCHCNHLLKA